ncbi:MAG TPA: HNH endonuclease [Candidatus Binataceae bacterium]|nr:HNH endonuclease [Candidatus Binataceae bacterium]
MKYELEPYHRDVPDEELLDDLRRVARELGKSRVTVDEYNERGRFHSDTLKRRLGSWFKATDKAGLKRTRILNISDEELFSNLVEIWTNLGKQPRYSDLKPETSKFAAGTYEKRFGTWRKALEAFVQWANEGEPPPTSNEVAKRAGRRTPRQPSLRLKVLVLMRDGNLCKLCGAKAGDGITKLHFDHYPIPWSKGGETVLENLQILCKECNLGKGDWTPENCSLRRRGGVGEFEGARLDSFAGAQHDLGR